MFKRLRDTQTGHCKAISSASRDNGFCMTFQSDANNATANLLALLELWPTWRLPRALVLASEASPSCICAALMLLMR